MMKLTNFTESDKTVTEAWDITLANRPSLGQDVFHHLRNAIIDQTIPPGIRLVESRIAEMLGISRTPVREAIHKLEREDWIRRMPRGGYQTVELSSFDVEETFGIRSVLEAYAARLATERHEPGDISILYDTIQEYQVCLDASSRNVDIQELSRINTEFHEALYRLSRCPRLVRIINTLRAQIYRFRPIILKQESMARASNDDHRKMVKAMEQKDGDAVEALVKEHISKGKEAVLKNLHRNRPEDHSSP